MEVACPGLAQSRAEWKYLGLESRPGYNWYGSQGPGFPFAYAENLGEIGILQINTASHKGQPRAVTTVQWNNVY